MIFRTTRIRCGSSDEGRFFYSRSFPQRTSDKLSPNSDESMNAQPSSSSSTKNAEELPQSFDVRYLGFREAKGLWGIKHTRKPVDLMVASVKESKTNLHVIKLVISEEGCRLESVCNNKTESRYFPIETISYGVQDLIYTRVFAIIVVKEATDDYSLQSPFECHAFVCDCRQSARKLTYTLATAFQVYSHKLKTFKARTSKKVGVTDNVHQRFAIDLRTPEEIESELKLQDSSEA